MKRILAVLLILVLAVSLCACGEALSAEEKALVGDWVRDTTTNETALVLTDSGRGMRWMWNNSGDAITWEVFEGMLYIYDYRTEEKSSSYRYIISGNNLLDAGGNVIYTKK